MKPDWKDSPEWANWLLKDHGIYTWSENYPELDGSILGKFSEAGEYSVGVSDSPEPRP
jgi:hypothetical protein